MNAALPLAVVGGGGAIADLYYFPILSADETLRPGIWIVEPAIERGKKAAAKYGFPVDQVVADIVALPPTVKTAINATPSHLHLATTLTLIERGVSVLVEKPFAETAADAQAMNAAGDGKVVLTANHFRRLAPTYSTVREYIRSGKLGAIKTLTWAEGHKFDWPTQSGFNFRRPWPNGRPRGSLLDIGVHVFDVICWWLDMRPAVKSAVMDAYGGPEAYVTSDLVAGQTEIKVSISFNAKLANEFIIEGDKGSIRGQTAEYTRFEYKPAGGSWRTVKAEGDPDRAVIAKTIIMNFLDVVSGKGALIITPASVVTPIAVIDEIYASATDYLPDCYKEWVA